MTTETDARARWLQVGRRDGGPLPLGALNLTPRSWSLRAALPYGAVVLNRPVGFTVDQGGEPTYLVLRDPTRWAQFAAYGLSAILVILALLLPHRGSGHRDRDQTG